MNIQSVIKEIQNYVPQNQDEIACQKEMLSFLHAFKSQAFSRESEEGHFSASCIVVNEEKRKFFLSIIDLSILVVCWWTR